MMEMFSICAVQYGSHQPDVTTELSATKDLNFENLISATVDPWTTWVWIEQGSTYM